MQRFSYAKVVTDENGESRFEDVEVTMQEAQFAPPAPPVNLAALGPAEAVALMGGDADWGGDIPHPAPARQIVCVLKGRGKITTSDGESREFGPGEFVLVEDTSGRGHASRFLDDDFVAMAIRLAL